MSENQKEEEQQQKSSEEETNALNNPLNELKDEEFQKKNQFRNSLTK